MTKHTHEEIMDALRVIKDTCDGNRTCGACPFLDTTGDSYGCYMKAHSPYDWAFHTPKPEVWRAFK